MFDSLTCLVEETEGKEKFEEAEGVELCLIMLREGKMSKSRALRLLDHALGGRGGAAPCERLIESAGLKTVFGMFMKSVSVDYGSYSIIRLSVYSKTTKSLSIWSESLPHFFASFQVVQQEESELLQNSSKKTTRRSLNLLSCGDNMLRNYRISTIESRTSKAH